MFQMENVKYAYKKNNFVINDLSFTVEQGQTVCILGHNGAGKTTVLRLLLGLIKPISGDIKTVKSFNIAYAPETNCVYENLTCEQNMIFRARLAHLNDIQTSIDEALKLVNLQDKRYVKAKELSNGMRRRLTIAMALLENCDVIFMDEPTNGLDPESLQILHNLIMNQKEKTLIINTHDLELASKVADKIIIIQNGKQVYEGTDTKNIKEDYFKYVKSGEENDV